MAPPGPPKPVYLAARVLRLSRVAVDNARMSLPTVTLHPAPAPTSRDVGSGSPALDDAVRSAVARGSALGEPAAVLVIAVDDTEAEQMLASVVRGADVVADLGDGSCGVVLFGISRLPAACVAERLERRLAVTHDGPGTSRVGMSLVSAWDRRDAAAVLRAARTDLRERLAASGAPDAHLAAA